MDSSTIFLVDDDREFLEGMSARLRSFGFRVEAYPKANFFLDRFDPDRPGILLLDLRPSRSAGLEVLDILREMGSEYRVLFLTIHPEIDRAAQAVETLRNFLLCPLSDEELAARLQDAVIEDRRVREERAETEDVLRTIRSLTRREREVLDFALRGWTNRTISLVEELMSSAPRVRGILRARGEKTRVIDWREGRRGSGDGEGV